MAMLTVTGAAQAQTHTGPDPSLPSIPMDAVVSSTGFDLDVVGTISSRCQLGGGRELDFGDLTVPKQIATPMGLYCNVPFDLAVRAVNGGLSHESLPSGQGGFSGTLAYGLDIEVPVLDPHQRMLSGRFESAQLRNGVSLSSDNAIAKGGAALKIQTAHAEGHGLLAGQYSETLIFTIAPRM